MVNFNGEKSKMQLNIISYTLFFFLLVIFFSSLAFAPWTTNNPPESPHDFSVRTCVEWIIYHGFTMSDYPENRRLSLERNYKLDKKASTWAAIYAFKIGGKETPPQLLPEAFCNGFGEDNMFAYPYKALKQEKKTCVGWITLYRMTNDNLTYNIDYAKNQDIEKIEEMSIWAYSYFIHLKRWRDTYSLSPTAYCTSIGKKVEEGAIFMPFINAHEPLLSCAAWIYLYEYRDDLPYNYYKVEFREQQYETYRTSIQYWPRHYAIYLRSRGLYGPNMTPWQYCIYMNAEEPKSYSFLYTSVNTRNN